MTQVRRILARDTRGCVLARIRNSQRQGLVTAQMGKLRDADNRDGRNSRILKNLGRGDLRRLLLLRGNLGGLDGGSRAHGGLSKGEHRGGVC